MTRSQRGTTLAEALVALAILGFVLLSSMAVITWSDRAERRASERVVALELCCSLAERVRVAPFESLSSGEVDLSAEYVPLPEPRALLEVEADAVRPLKRVTVIVTWGGERPGRVALDTSVGAAEIYR